MAQKNMVKCPHCQKAHAMPTESSARPDDAVWREALRYVMWLGLGTGTLGAAIRLADFSNPPYWIAPVCGLALTVTLEVVRLSRSQPRPRPAKPARGEQKAVAQ